VSGGAARIVLRPVGNPLPLGFLALAGGTLLVSGVQLGWLKPADVQHVAIILITFVFPLQLLASVFGYLARDVAAGTGMGLLAGTWLSIGLVTLTSPPGSTSDALGLFLLLAGAAMLAPAAASATTNSSTASSGRRAFESSCSGWAAQWIGATLGVHQPAPGSRSLPSARPASEDERVRKTWTPKSRESSPAPTKSAAA
jgi:UPF0716 family protein affecting phage T7 exclusion